MKLVRFEVYGLFGKREAISLSFNNDINIITGRNGAGKTTALKLMWYILSGNILLALREIKFNKAILETEKYKCSVTRLNSNHCKVEWEEDGEVSLFEDEYGGDEDIILSNAEDIPNEMLMESGSSVYFPTFRRIEGGYSIESNKVANAFSKNSNIEDALSSLSNTLSNHAHTFVSSLSTLDIERLIVKKYTDLSSYNNELQQEETQEIVRKIKQHQRSKSNEREGLKLADQLINEIANTIREREKQSDELFKPFEVMKEHVLKHLQHTGIKVGKNIGLGEAANAINSEYLSAGEKQIFSFIAYNAFNRNSIIIIDEPELSLHVDWQRQLVSTLHAQQSSNQFIFATHSPFIYGKYPEKEISISSDRGESKEQ